MRIPTLILAFLLPGLFLTAQDVFTEYGIMKPEEIALKECGFDPDADAVILAHEARADHDEQYRMITNHRVRLKILKEKGIDEGNIRLLYYSRDNFENIDQVQGRVYRVNEIGSLQFSELDKKSIYRKNVNKYYSEVVFAFPDVKVGSIIEYTYRSTMESYGGLDDWQFQQSLPVVKSRFSVVIIPNYEFAYRVQKREDYPVKVEPDRNSGRISFEMNNIPALESEPFMDARKDYLQRVIFQLSGYKGQYSKKYSTNWAELVRELNQHPSFGGQLGKNLSGSEEVIALAKTDSSQTARLNRIYQYVKTNLTWNGFSGIHSADGIKSAWSKKTGHSGDLNLILVNLLKEAGIEAYPMVVSERSHGRVNTEFPFLEQFNTVYAYAVADGKKYYLNTIDKFNPSHIIPYKILNTTGLIVSKRGGGLTEIKDDKFEYRDYINVTGTVHTNGQVDGRVFMSSADYARSIRLSSYKANAHDYLESLTGKGDGIQVDSFQLENIDTDTLPLQHKFLFRTALNSTGDYTMVPTYFFSDMQSNPFLNKVRFSNINFGYRQSININYYLLVEEGIRIDELPKSVRMMNAEKTIAFSRSVVYDEPSRRLVSRITITNTKSLFDAGEYPAVHEFYKKMFDYLNEQIVIKKS